jgi:hypothetical protein
MSSLPVFSLAGRSALVTGAGHGIDAAVARAFAGAAFITGQTLSVSGGLTMA